jgi:hypothetical protein
VCCALDQPGVPGLWSRHLRWSHCQAGRAGCARIGAPLLLWAAEYFSDWDDVVDLSNSPPPAAQQGAVEVTHAQSRPGNAHHAQTHIPPAPKRWGQHILY